jgi:putative membrane protein
MTRHPFLSEAARQRLGEAVAQVEARSAVEVVISVRPWSGRRGPAAWLGGALAGLGVLVFLMLIPTEFPIWSILVATGVAQGLVVAALWHLPAVERLLPGRRALAEDVLRAAQATFTAQELFRTRDRSALLVFVSLRERIGRVVADVGVRAALSPEEWTRVATSLEAVIAEHGVDGRAAVRLAEALETLAPLLGERLPRRADDTNELPDVAEEVA